MARKKMSTMQLIGIALLVVGVIVLVLGAYNLISFNSSTGGKIANKVAGAFGSQTRVVRNSLIQIGLGAAVSIVGFVLYRKR